MGHVEASELLKGLIKTKYDRHAWWLVLQHHKTPVVLFEKPEQKQIPGLVKVHNSDYVEEIEKLLSKALTDLKNLKDGGSANCQFIDTMHFQEDPTTPRPASVIEYKHCSPEVEQELSHFNSLHPMAFILFFDGDKPKIGFRRIRYGEPGFVDDGLFWKLEEKNHFGDLIAQLPDIGVRTNKFTYSVGDYMKLTLQLQRLGFVKEEQGWEE